MATSLLGQGCRNVMHPGGGTFNGVTYSGYGGATAVGNYNPANNTGADDTQAIIDAVNLNRGMPGGLGAIGVYIPPGTYGVSRQLLLWTPLVFFGEPSNPPTIYLKPNSMTVLKTGSQSNAFAFPQAGENHNLYSTDSQSGGNGDGGRPYRSNNNNFCVYIHDVNFTVLSGNTGCSSVMEWEPAQTSALRNVVLTGTGTQTQALLTESMATNPEAGGGGVLQNVTMSGCQMATDQQSPFERLFRGCTFNGPCRVNGSVLICFICCNFNGGGAGFNASGGALLTLDDCVFGANTPFNPGSFSSTHIENCTFSTANTNPTIAAGVCQQWTSGTVTLNGTGGISGSASQLNSNTVLRGTPFYNPPYANPSATAVNIQSFGSSPWDAALNNAFASGATDVVFPPGSYQFNSTITLSANRRLFGLASSMVTIHGSANPVLSVTGRNVGPVGIFGILFDQNAGGQPCLNWNGDQLSVMMDTDFTYTRPNQNTPTVMINFQTGGGFWEDSTPALFDFAIEGGICMKITSTDPLYLIAVDPQHYNYCGPVLTNAQNVIIREACYEILGPDLAIGQTGGIIGSPSAAMSITGCNKINFGCVCFAMRPNYSNGQLPTMQFAATISNSGVALWAVDAGGNQRPSVALITEGGVNYSGSNDNFGGPGMSGYLRSSTITNSAPTVSATGATLIGLNSATLNGSVISPNGQPVTLDGFVWGPQNSTPPQTYPNQVTGNPSPIQSGAFTFPLAGLTTNQPYHYKSFANNSLGQGLSGDIAFTPSPPPPFVQGFVSNSVIDGTAVPSLTASFPSQAQGNTNIIAISFHSGSANNITVSDTKGNSYSIASPLTTSGTDSQVLYYCPSIAVTAVTNTVTVSFSPSVPYVSLRIAEYHGLGGIDVHSEGSSSTAGTTASVASVSTTNAADVIIVCPTCSSGLNGFVPGFTERVTGGAYGSDIQDESPGVILNSFTAPSPINSSPWVENMVAFLPSGTTSVPSVSANSASGIGSTTATLNGSITSNGQLSITADGFDWGTTTAYGTHVNVTPPVQSGSFLANLTVLSPGVTYHYRATAQNSKGTGVSSDQQFSTTSIGSSYSLINNAFVSPASISASTLTFAPLWAQASGGILIATIGYTSSSITVTVSDSVNGSYSIASGPTIDATGGITQYVFYRSNIKTSASGTNTITCTFSSNIVTLPDLRVSEFSSTLGSAWTVNQSIGLASATAATDTSGNMPATTVSNALIYGAGYTTQGLSAGPGFTLLDATTDGNLHEYETVTSVGVYSATGSDFVGGRVIMQAVAFVASSANSIPSVGISAATTGTTTATLNGSITSNGNQNITIEGFNYGPTTAYGTFVAAVTTVQSGAFSANITGLTSNTTYHFQATATNASGPGVSVDQPFTTGGAVGHTPTIIQHFSTATNYNGKDGPTGGQVNPGNPFHISWMHPTIAGNCLIVEVSANNTTTPTVTDDKANVYSFVKNVSNGTTVTSVFSCFNCISGAIKLITTFNANTYYVHLSGTEIAFVGAVSGSSSLNAGGSATVSAGTLATVSAGSMILMFGRDTANGTQSATNNLTAYTAGAGFELLGTDTWGGTFSQFSTSISGTNITPTAALSGGNIDAYNAVALVLTASSQGAIPPPGIRILRSQGVFVVGVQKAVQFPCRGNLVYATSAFANGSGWTFPGGWNVIPDVNTSGAWIAGTNNPSFTVAIGGLLSGAPQSISLRMYDVAGSASSPFDKYTPTATLGNNNTYQVTVTPQNVSWINITPSTSNGLLIATLPIGVSCISEHSTPTLTINDHCWYGNMWGADTMENVDGYAHILNSVAGTPYTFDWAIWAMNYPPVNETLPYFEAIWGIAVAFKTATFTESADQTAITTVGPVITDYNGNTWAITSGGQVSLNGITIGFTANATEIAYAGRVFWQFNGTSWYSFAPNGSVSLGPVATSPLVGSVTVAPSVSAFAPTGLSPSTVTLNGSITSNGNANITQDGFKYGVAGGPSGTYGTTAVATTVQSGAISVNLTSLTANSTYHYIVFATNSVGTGQTTDQTFTTLTPPSVPTGFSASTVSNSSISVNWTVPVSAVDPNYPNSQITYPVDHMGGEFPAFTQFGVAPGVSSGADSILDSGLLHPGTIYSYRMRALDPANLFSGYTSTFTGTTAAADLSIPTAPGTPIAGLTTSTSITIIWATSTDTQEASNTLTYTLQRSTTGSFTAGSTIATNIPGVSSGSISYPDSGLTPLTTYFYQVQAVNPANLSGNNKGPFSGTGQGTTLATPPSFVQGNASSASSVSSATCSFNSAQTTGDGNLVVISTSSAAAINIVGPVTDQAGNTYTLIDGPTTIGSSPILTQWIYFSNI